MKTLVLDEKAFRDRLTAERVRLERLRDVDTNAVTRAVTTGRVSGLALALSHLDDFVMEVDESKPLY